MGPDPAERRGRQSGREHRAMSEMVERVAHVLMASDPQFESQSTIAKRVIEAMREPTEAMVEVGMQEFQDPCWPQNVRKGFGLMIDEALK